MHLDVPRARVRRSARSGIPAAAALVIIATALGACVAATGGGPTVTPEASVASPATSIVPTPSAVPAIPPAATPGRPGIAPVGRIWIIVGDEIRSVAATGGDERVEVPISDVATNFSFSPDGRRIAYQHGPDGPMTISIRDLDTGTTVDVDGPWTVFHEQIGWSPDGSQLVFSGALTSSGPDRLYTMPSDGSAGPALIGDDAIDRGRTIYAPTWSPDGRLIAFMSAPAGGGESEPNGRIDVIRPDGTGLRTLADGAWVPGIAWAPDPDSHLLLYRSDAGPALVDAAATNPERIVIEDGFWQSWSPDGSRIAYWHDGPKVVETADVRAGHPDPVRVFASFDSACDEFPELRYRAICSGPIWSPDGRFLTGVDIAGRDLLVAPADGSGVPFVLPDLAFPGERTRIIWRPEP